MVALERERQELRLELEEERRALERARGELVRQRERERVAEAARGQVERLLAGAASPAAQLLTQAHLVEAEGRPVAVGDVLAVALRLVGALEAEGLERVGRVGERAVFDLVLHEPLGEGAGLAAGSAVVVRFVGVGYRGVTLRKAGVEPAGAG